MSDYVTLLGAEDVQRAAGQIREAASEMSRAASEITEAVRQLRIVLEDDRTARRSWQKLAALLAVAREQPTQEKLPLGHPFVSAPEGSHYGKTGQCAHARNGIGLLCGQPESAHQPTQDKEDQ